MRYRWMAGTAPHKTGDIETNTRKEADIDKVQQD